MSRFRSAVALALALAAGLGLSVLLSRWTPSEEATGGRARPRRVILFAPNLTESAFALGHGQQVVAVTDFCVWPPEATALPRVGGMIDPNLERILALDPDLLVVQGESVTLRSLARSHGLALERLSMDRDLASVFAGMARLDSLLGGGEAGQALVQRLRGELEELRLRAASLARPRVLLVLGHDPGALTSLFTMGKGSFLNELVELAGGIPHLGEHPQPYFHLGLESLLADPPDVAIELRPGAEIGEEEREAVRTLWREAGLDRLRVELMGFDGTMIPGPRVAETARALQAALHPQLAEAP